jgi:hypothetical protein
LGSGGLEDRKRVSVEGDMGAQGGHRATSVVVPAHAGALHALMVDVLGVGLDCARAERQTALSKSRRGRARGVSAEVAARQAQ